LCRLQLASGKGVEALQCSTNLLALAATSGRKDLRAESVAFQAGVLEQVDRLPAAVATYALNLDRRLPLNRQREALLQIVELNLRQNQTEEAAKQLEDFLEQHPGEDASDV